MSRTCGSRGCCRAPKWRLHHEQSFRFGEHLVEQVQQRPDRAWPGWFEETVEFRVRRRAEDREEAAVLARLEATRVQRVFAHGNSLVLFVNGLPGGTGQPATTEVQVVDFEDPSRPRLAGKLALPVAVYRHWPLAKHFAVTEQGLAFQGWGPAGHETRLLHLDLRDPASPKLSEQRLPLRGRETEFGWEPEANDPTLVADALEPSGFYLGDRKEDGTVTGPGGLTSKRYRYFVQRWQPDGAGWTAGPEINVPGRLLRTWRAADGSRLLLSESTEYRDVDPPVVSALDSRLSLMRAESVSRGQMVARLLDSHPLVDRQVSSLILDGDRLVVTARRVPYVNEIEIPGWQTTSDRLLVFDLAGEKFQLVHDQPSHLRDLRLLSSYRNKLLVKAGGDGILVMDLTAPTRPRTAGFLPTGDRAPTSSSWTPPPTSAPDIRGCCAWTWGRCSLARDRNERPQRSADLLQHLGDRLAAEPGPHVAAGVHAVAGGESLPAAGVALAG